MRHHMMKRRLEYTMLVGIALNVLAFMIPIINFTLTHETKQYTEGYSIGSLVGLLIPAVLNGGMEGLSNPPLSLMAVMLVGVICFIASIFTVVLVIKSMLARKANLFCTIAVSVFEALCSLCYLMTASQTKNFIIRDVVVEPFKGNLRGTFNMFGLLIALAVLALAFVNIFLILGIIRSGEEIDEIEEEKPARPASRDRMSQFMGDNRGPRSSEYSRTRQPHRAPTESAPPHRTPIRNNVYSGSPRTEDGSLHQTRPLSATGMIDRDNLPRQTAPSRPAPSAQSQQAVVSCAKCGAKCRRGTRFCNICGEPLPRPVRRCRICGEVITEKDVFCPSCGANIK